MSASSSSTAGRYPALARAFHWLSVVFLVLAWVAVEFEDTLGKSSAMLLHKSLGLSLFFLVAARLIYRATYKAPPLTMPMSELKKKGAHAVHALLYLLLLAQPLTGILMTWYGGRDLPFFGLFSIASPVAKNPELSKWFYELHHDIVFPLLVALSVLHIGFALYHHYVKKDGLIDRMR